MGEAPQRQHERYSVVCFADAATAAAVEQLRRRLPPRVAVMPAHVTVKGSFTGPQSLETVQARIARAAREAGPMQVQVGEVAVSASHLGLRIKPNPELVALHDRLYTALSELVTDVYGDCPGAGYHPHLTALYGLTADDRVLALELVPQLRRIGAVGLTAVSLVGRVGGSLDGRWEEIRSVSLGG
jgi:2'-5' RNA ligase